MLTVEQCEMIVAEGEEIGEGAYRKVYAHDDFPEWIVKKEHGDGYREQNKQEYANYLRLTSTIAPVCLPEHIRIPQTFRIGGFIVQQFVGGEHPTWDEWGPETGWEYVCHCKKNGMPECYTKVPNSVILDVHEYNVLWDGYNLWVIDLVI